MISVIADDYSSIVMKFVGNPPAAGHRYVDSPKQVQAVS
jgi:hypothetical protein